MNHTLDLESISPSQETKIIHFGHIEHSTTNNLYVAMRSYRVIAINFGINRTEFIQLIENKFKTQPSFAPDKTQSATEQIQFYLDGQRNFLNIPIDLSFLTNFQQQVLLATKEIPFGELTTYLGIAKKIGKPEAVRAVGQALAHNPVPIVIPCHRVIASNGSLGGYSGGGGLEAKVKLLQLEGVLLG